MNKPRISIIVAMSDNRVIGNKGEIPWNIPGEQKRVREITTPHPLIMGRKTHEAIGRILSDRLNIIVTSDRNYNVDGGVVVHSLDEAIEVGVEAEKTRLRQGFDGQSEIFIFGGGKIYEEAINQVDRLYLTIVHKTVEGDAFFPDYSSFTKEISREEKEFGNLTYTYLTLER
ncbi:MAG: dihydrofolate reductase [Candidatus Levybacteria bacterium]|nr:dihydrofolate reductase [Candidatus Levybacteria bacterium]